MGESNEQSLLEHLGLNALAFVLASDPEAVEARIGDPAANCLSDQQERVLSDLIDIDAHLEPRFPGEDNATEWADQLSQASDLDPGMSLGNLAHVVSGGEVEVVDPTLGEIEQLLMKLAIDCFPGLLVKESDAPFLMTRSLGRALHSHPANEAFQALALRDTQLGRLFTEESESTGPTGSVLRSTGSGGTIQLWMLAETFINSGWIAASIAKTTPSAKEFVAAVLTSFDKARAAVAGHSTHVAARVGLAGMLLPSTIAEVKLGWALLRRSDERDSPYIRVAGANGQLSGTNERGETAVINYHGDLVLELDVPYAVKVRELPIGEPWPEPLLASSRATEAAVEDLRLGLLLALPDRRAALHTSWQTSADPLSGHRLLGWSDLTRAIGLMPTQLNAMQVRKWKEWAELIHQHRTPSIAVAIRRMLAAVAERRTMEDILVDAVIVWENLFGAKTETNLRVCSSLAWLLGTSATDRKSRFARYKKIYGFRSAVVHGASSIRQDQLQEFAMEAVEISIEALRAIFNKRPDLLALTSSEERSIEILHGGRPSRRA